MSAGGGTVVFLGPTMSLDAARAILPDATYRPPVAQGDVYSLLGPGQPEAVGIVDGVFYQDLPVWHKEIVAALASGVAVYGSSSMGALRAAECGPFGMVGVGAIYEDFAAGRLTDDDEVAVAHDGEEAGWRPRTEPLVNLRATFARALDDGCLEGTTAECALRVAKSMWFVERTRPAFLAALAEAGLRPDEVAAVRAALDDGYVDQKRLDAQALLARLRARVPGEGRATATLERSHVFVAFAERDRKVSHGDATLRLEEIARHAALHLAGFAELRDRALDRELVDELAWLWGVHVTDDEVAQESERIRARLSITDTEALAAWLAANDVDATWFAELARREATARRLRDWAQVRRGKRLLVGPVLDELRLAGRYEATKAAAAIGASRGAPPEAGFDEELARGDGVQATSGAAAARAAELVRDQIRAGWRPDVAPARFAGEAGFDGVRDLLDELARMRAVRAKIRERLRLLESLFDPS